MKLLMIVLIISTLLGGCSSEPVKKKGGPSVTIPDKISTNDASDFSYEIADGEVKITGLINDALQFVGVPDTIDGYPVTIIGTDAFKDYDKLIAISMPDTIKKMETSSISLCFNLYSIHLPENIEELEPWAIYGCSSLSSITLPNSLSSIGNIHINECDSLSEIIVEKDNPYFTVVDNVLFSKDMTTLVLYPQGRSEEKYEIPDGVKTINSFAFKDNKLKEIILPEGLETILSSNFNVLNIEELSIPASVTLIDDYFCDFTKKLININVDEDNPNYTSIDGVLFDKNVSTLIKYPGSKIEEQYTVPDTVKVISRSAFQNLKHTKKVILKEGVEELMYDAFAENSKMEIHIPASVTEINKIFFLGEDNVIITPKGSQAEQYAIDNSIAYKTTN